MIKLKSLLVEHNDEVVEKFISLLPKYDLEYHIPLESKYAFSWRGSIYPTITDKEHIVSIALDRTNIFSRNGVAWVGDPSRPLLHGYVIQAIVTDPKFRSQGKAREVLKSVVAAADEAGLLLKLEPVPMKDFIKRGDKKLSSDQLKKWYEKHGFKIDQSPIMIRHPNSRN